MSDLKVNDLRPEDQMSDLTDSELSVTGGGGCNDNGGGDRARGGDGGRNFSIANGNQVVPIAFQGDNTAGGNQSADGGDAHA